MGIVPAGTGAAAARQPVGSGPYRLAEFVPDDHVTLAPFPQAYGGAPRNAGLVFQSCPTRRCAGSSCATAASISSSTICRPISCTASRKSAA